MSSARGFTLIELLVVISIIAVLSTIGMVVFGNVQMQARDAKRKQDLNALVTALEIYYNKNGSYPVGEWTNSKSWAGWFKVLEPDYIGSLPVDPKNTGCSVTDSPRALNCFALGYYSGGWCSLNGKGYILATRLESYQGEDYSQKLINNTCEWTEDSIPAPGLYVLSNP